MRVLTIFAKVVAVIILLFLLLVLFVRSPWGQKVIKSQAVSYLSNKTHTTISLDRLYITFGGNVAVEDLYIEDLNKDTLFYSRSLTADIPIWPIITGEGIGVDHLNWNGVRANVYRQNNSDGFNYQFLIDAFAASDSTSAVSSDTTSSTLGISIGKVVLNDIKANYNDEVSGMEASLDLGELDVSMDRTDLDGMQFEVGEAILKNSRVRYVQTKPLPHSSDTSAAPLPFFSFSDVDFHNVSALYRSDPDGIEANVHIGDFDLNAPVVDLKVKAIKVGHVNLYRSEVYINMMQQTQTHVDSIKDIRSDEAYTFVWPDWQVRMDEIDLEKNTVSYRINGAQVKDGVFNSEAIVLNQFELKGKDIDYRVHSTSGQLEKLSFKEGSGMTVKDFEFQWEINDQYFNLSDVNIEALNSQISGKVSAQYASVESLIDNPEQAFIDIEIPIIDLDIGAFYRFQPELKDNPYIQAVAEKSLTGNFQLEGELTSLEVPEASIRWGDHTALFATGNLYQPLDQDRVGFDFPNILIRSTRNDLIKFADEDSLGIQFPTEVRLTANASGEPDDLSAEMLLESTQGQIKFKGNYSNKDTLTFLSEIKVTNLRLETLLQIPELGPLFMTARTEGQGQDINSLNASLKASIDSFSYNGYPIRDWSVKGDIADGQGELMSAYQDSNLNVVLEADVVLDSVAPDIRADLNVKGADLADLGLVGKQIELALDLDAHFTGKVDSFRTSVLVEEGTILYNATPYQTGEIHINAFLAPDTTAGSINSRMLDLSLRSNTSPNGFVTAISRHIQSYLIDSIAISDSLMEPVIVSMEGSLSKDPLISEVFLPGLTAMDTLDLSVDFHEGEKNLAANIDIPYLNYAGVEIDSFGVSANSDYENFNLDLGLREVIAGPVTINRTYFTNQVRNNTLYSNFEAQYEEKDLIHFKTEISEVNDSLRIHFDPAVLVFDGRDWNIPSTNLIRIGENKIEFKDFRIQSGNQRLTIDDNPGPNDLNVQFKAFEVANIISYFNPDSLLATGALDGRITVEEPLGDAGLIADLEINNFHVLEVDMGILSLYGQTEDARNYTANLELSGGEVDLNADGEYHATENDSDIELEMIIDRIGMKAVQSFSMGSISASAGYINGQVEASGSLADPDYDGRLLFHDGSVTPAMLQTPFRLGSQQVTFDNKGINLVEFEIRDEDGNSFTVDGDIITENIFNPAFDLTMEADNFKVLDATKEENDQFYGTASFDAQANLTGDLNLPILDLQLDVGTGTNVTYVMPQGEAALNKREGIVEFVNKENPDDIMSEEEEETLIVKGYDINAVVTVRKEADIKVIISEGTGDHFKISGDGDLNFTMDPTGRMTLSGLYTLSDGHYEMNLYNLVNRRFDVAEGSTVSWSGDPFDASMDVSAIYNVETSPATLMAAQTSGADPSVQNQYSRKLPFLVYLNVNGQLSEPKLTFSLDMPEDARGVMGGQVYGRIQQINQQENLLNKQVFSLLVLGRFYPDAGSDGSSGGIVNVARDNLNQALADQLNLFSDKLLGDTGLELDFGLDSYTDYEGQSAQNRTQLDIAAQKKFFDNRLIVKVGSEVDIEGGNANPQEENPLIGNVSVEYLLTEDGQIRIRGFRKNVYENVIDGQTIVSGLALIFTREFNKFNEMWSPLLDKEGELSNGEEK